MNRRVLFLPIAIVVIVILSGFWMWYNNGSHKLQRCVEAQADHFYSTPEGKEMHSHGTDPPRDLFVLECNQLGFH